ncbi:hypothetical protein [Catellatospora coxensis]|uniref:hypothetical protein n=1 Tax=Catellatospora coxensis TaxID=310354 RepID=UPI0031D1FD5E
MAEEDHEHEPSAGRRRRRGPSGLTVLVAVTAVILAGGVLSQRWVRSPQQVAAEAAPPPPTVLTAAVEHRVLKDTVVLRGVVVAGGRFEVSPSPREGGRAVVTGVRVRAGQTFPAGAVLLEVSGRPLIALPGSIPVYRDLRPGSTGRDVTQLQKALTGLGHRVTDPAGRFGAGTQRALRELYREVGYEVGTTGADDERAVAAQAEAGRHAERLVQEAEATLAALLRTAPSPASSSSDPQDPVAQARTALRYAGEDLAAARQALVALQARSGPMLPAGEVVFLPAFPGRVEALTARVGEEVRPPLVTVSSGALVVQASLNPAQSKLVREGMPVEITSEVLGVSATGQVDKVGDLTQDESGARSHPLVVRPTGTALPESFAGQDVRLAVEAASSSGPVLVVPLSALFAAPDGQTSVVRQVAGGTERVAVTVGVSGQGYAAVTAVAGQLAPGDLVVVGAA